MYQEDTALEEFMHHPRVGAGALLTSGNSPFIIVSAEPAIPNPCFLRQHSAEQVFLEIIESVIEFLQHRLE